VQLRTLRVIGYPGRYFSAGNKKPAEAGFFKTIPTSCR